MRRIAKVAPAPAMKAYGANRGTAPPILNLDARWKWSVSRLGRVIPEKKTGTY